MWIVVQMTITEKHIFEYATFFGGMKIHSKPIFFLSKLPQLKQQLFAFTSTQTFKKKNDRTH